MTTGAVQSLPWDCTACADYPRVNPLQVCPFYWLNFMLPLSAFHNIIRLLPSNK